MAVLFPRPCLSAGHGLSSRVAGKIDPGAAVPSQSGATEASKALGLTQRVYADLVVLGPQGMTPYLRDAGYYATADDDAVRHKCDVLLEVHYDSSTNKDAHGTSTYIWPSASSQSKRLAGIVQAAVAGVIGRGDRGVRTANFAVLRFHSGMASVLLETCFASNLLDILTFNRRVDRVELAIVNALLKYYGWPLVSSLPRKWSAAQKKAYNPFPKSEPESWVWVDFAEPSPAGKAAAVAGAKLRSDKLIVRDGPSGPSDAILSEHGDGERDLPRLLAELQARRPRNIIYLGPDDVGVRQGTEDGSVRRLNYPTRTTL